MMADMTTPPITHHGNVIEADRRSPRRFGVGRRSAVEALDGLDLVAPAGQVTAVLGPNGAGKTTFVRAVATLLRPDGGHAAGGRHRRRPATRSRCAGVIGLAGQSAAVEPAMTGRENLVMVARLFGHGRAAGPGRRRRGARASSASTDAADRLVRGYSGGMRRRLDLGASLVGAPRLLLLDEPTTGLDPRSRIELWDAIRALVRAGTDVLLTTQYLEEADQLADHIVIIDHGRAIATGTPERAEGPGRARRGRDPGPPTPSDLGARRVGARAALGDDERPGRRAGPPGRRRGRPRHRRPGRRRARARRARASTSTTSACAARPSTRCSSPSPAGPPPTPPDPTDPTPTRRLNGATMTVTTLPIHRHHVDRPSTAAPIDPSRRPARRRRRHRVDRSPAARCASSCARRSCIVVGALTSAMFLLIFRYVFGGAIGTGARRATPTS